MINTLADRIGYSCVLLKNGNFDLSDSNVTWEKQPKFNHLKTTWNSWA